ncbi:MAG: hypothetical protein J0H12_07515 [Candidatus Paracaedimonas acanthamoebae]|uniref:Uncharacterized protein n=1 Tax=Candidatus Paracaedimonas acanthamoebae TaxID=244581 RepID=A0A8J7Q1R3_9PROT|nr:hypothetical protein [Candidatus Paracaedimonas acanthamoebae]
MYNTLIPYFKEKRVTLNIPKALKRSVTLLGISLYHTTLQAAENDMVLKDVFAKIEKTLTGGGFRLATIAGGLGGIVISGVKGNWPVAGLFLGLAVTAHAFVDWVKASYTFLI